MFTENFENAYAVFHITSKQGNAVINVKRLHADAVYPSILFLTMKIGFGESECKNAVGNILK